MKRVSEFRIPKYRIFDCAYVHHAYWNSTFFQRCFFHLENNNIVYTEFLVNNIIILYRFSPIVARLYNMCFVFRFVSNKASVCAFIGITFIGSSYHVFAYMCDIWNAYSVITCCFIIFALLVTVDKLTTKPNF